MSGIDTDSTLGGDQAFTWGGQSQAIVVNNSVTWFEDVANNRTVVQMDTADADLNVNMVIVLHGTGHGL